MSNFIKSQLSFDTIIDLKLSKYYDYIPREKFYIFFKKLNYFIGLNKEREFASVHNDVFLELLGQKNLNGKKSYIFPKLLQILVFENIIEYSSYYNNKYNQKYNYTRKYWYSNSFTFDINNTIMENIEITNIKTYKKISKLYFRPTVKHLYEQYDLMKSDRFFFDYEGALNWCIKEKELNRFNDENNNFNKNKWNCYMLMINDLSDKNIYTYQETTFYSNYTRLENEFKQFIHLDNEKTFTLDLYNDKEFLQLYGSIFNNLTKKGIIYKATNNLTGLSYIGQTTKTLEERKYNHYNLMIENNFFHETLKSYDKNDWNWEILLECNYNELNIKEKYYIKLYNTFKNGYNSTTGGDNFRIFYSILNNQFTNKLLKSSIINNIPYLISAETITFKQSDKEIIFEKFNNLFDKEIQENI